MYKECPICGRPFSVLQIVLAENDARFQCPHCWSRVRATGAVSPPAGNTILPPAQVTRRTTQSKRRKK